MHVFVNVKVASTAALICIISIITFLFYFFTLRYKCFYNTKNEHGTGWSLCLLFQYVQAREGSVCLKQEKADRTNKAREKQVERGLIVRVARIVGKRSKKQEMKKRESKWEKGEKSEVEISKDATVLSSNYKSFSISLLQARRWATRA